MPTPTKPFTVLKTEKKSHRTKAELNLRKQGEAALISGMALSEHPEVKDSPVAHREFLRLNELLTLIDKNDAIYEAIINRYCIITSECADLQDERKSHMELLAEIKQTMRDIGDDLDPDKRASLLIEITNSMGKIIGAINRIDGTLQSKRKMLFDIERENVLTIASALRSIPKKTENKTSALLEALSGG